MPGFNGRGPDGFGAMTGRGRGRCAVGAGPQSGRFGGMGRGLGRRRGLDYGADADWTGADQGLADENAALRQQVDQMQQTLEKIQQQLENKNL